MDTKTDKVTFCKHRSHQKFLIWKLRWNDTWKNKPPVCVLMDSKLKDFNVIKFRDEPERQGLYYVSKKVARRSNSFMMKSSDGKREYKMREVSFDKLKEFEYDLKCLCLF